MIRMKLAIKMGIVLRNLNMKIEAQLFGFDWNLSTILSLIDYWDDPPLVQYFIVFQISPLLHN